MQVTTVNRPGAAAARVSLDHGETLTAEAGAMIAFSDDVDVETTSKKKVVVAAC